MSTVNDLGGARPPSPPRLRSTDLPEVIDGPHTKPEPFLSGHPILPEDIDINDLSIAQLQEMNQRLLEESMGTERPLISRPEDISVLRDEYSNLPNFVSQIDTLSNQGYRTIIHVKGDGDCFYRALAFAYLHRLVHSASARSQDQLSVTKTMLEDAGFDEIVYDLPYDIITNLIRSVSEAHELWDTFTDPSASNFIVMYMRLLTSAQMHLKRFFFAEFLSDYGSELGAIDSVDDFRRQFVEPLGKEADDIQVTALVLALNIHVKVAYLDGHSPDGHVNFHDFGEDARNDVGNSEPLVLLYRSVVLPLILFVEMHGLLTSPGHYDILQKGV
ncbi:cysteine proteinase [Gyrodon lividus]|nr:cysteine proteinase [Gyrodon lividus]